ncbi:MAG: hypothetical protein FWC97_04645 [Treponema sp.]|nr:hypothetical protein [Treponema sp.]
MTTQPELLFEKDQYRMNRLQVFNWGTFSGLHDIPISNRGFLFVGRSGTGKTTLLDAFSALLIPPRWVDFNAAAREGERTGRDRNLVSYIRGAWAEQKDGESGEYVTRSLRQSTTWSAIALSYRNVGGHTVTLVRIFWLRGNSKNNADVKHSFMLIEREFNLNELDDFGHSDFDIRKLKQTFHDAFFSDEFRSYCERFCRVLGIENERNDFMALRLLHKTQSAKNIGDLNIFLREFMLDKPETFDAAERLVNEFGELNAAHQAVVTARQQIEVLSPAREKHNQMDTMKTELSSIDELRAGIDNYRETRRLDLFKEHIALLKVDTDGLEGEAAQKQELLENYSNTLRDLQRRHREIGGDRIEQLQNEKRSLELQRTERLRKREQAEYACNKLGQSLSETPQEFAKLVGEAREELEGAENKSKNTHEELLNWDRKKQETESEFIKIKKEVQALQRQPSNIPAEMLDLRNKIASAIGISESVLPFAGELIEVKPDESSWQGAIERVLHGFALSLLVDERNYSALSNYINNTHLSGKRLVYYRTHDVASGKGRNKTLQGKPVNVDSLVLKLNVKEGSFAASSVVASWLRQELRQRFDYACVESVQAFRSADRALTREGQVKHSKTRHEKDDRRNVDDRRNWVLGFDNKEKLALFQQQAQELAFAISECDKKINILSEHDKESRSRSLHCQTLVNLQWQEIDVASLLNQISEKEKLICEAQDGNTELQDVAKRINEQESLVNRADNDLRNTKVKHASKIKEMTDVQEKFDTLKNDSSIVSLIPHQKKSFDELYEKVTDHLKLDNIDNVTTSVDRSLSKKAEGINREIAGCEKNIESIFADFKRTWPMDAGDLDVTLFSAPDYFAKLTRLETDGLPAHEQRFFGLLQNQSHQNLAALNTYLNDARKAILERMDIVNDSLSQVPFNKSANGNTYLHIDASDRQLPEVREFKQDIQQALSNAWSEDAESYAVDHEGAEARFLVFRKMVERLSSQDPEQKRWRESVLDVRQHVEFIGRESDESGVEVEVYRSGAGKSGGQRQKLATTCLAAALRYQLGGSENGIPMYAPVVLDEAFDKADNEFTALAMNIFNNFGFQMIVATPLRSVMTLEPFIGGACFVDITERCKSGVLHIEYDDDRQRLNLPVAALSAAGANAADDGGEDGIETS